MKHERRFARRDGKGQPVVIPASLNVRVLDISKGGMLLHSPDPVEPGARGRLRLVLGGAPFEAEVEVRRVTAEQDGTGGYRIGAMFLALGPDLEELIERAIAG